MRKSILSIMLFSSMVLAHGQHASISPRQFGLDTAQNGISRYYVLYNTHKAAVEQGVDVDYSGIGELDIELPADAKPIPLTQNNSFQNLVLNVTNNQKSCFLFERIMPTDSIDIPKELIDKGDFRSIPQLSDGLFLLVLEDKRLWVDNRVGYKYGHTRCDILLINNGLAVNKTIMPYNTPETEVVATYCRASSIPTVVSDITVNRTAPSTCRTFVFDIKNVANLVLRNIEINTPPTKLLADAAIRVYNVADFQADSIRIDGTYSRSDYYGYGFSLDNIWKSRFSNLWGHASWGIFGTNNLNDVELESSDLNRFDVHCYGRDVTIRNCIFRNLYNQFSSLYGTLRYENCTFENHTPVLLESSYNAYTPFDLIVDSCTFNITKRSYYLVDARTLSNTVNSRPEVSAKNLPNIKIMNSKIHLKETVHNYFMFRFSEVSYKDEVGYLKNIDIQNLTTDGGKVRLRVSTKSFQNANPIFFPMKNKKVGF